MPTPDYILKLRKFIGHDLILTQGVAGIILNEQNELLLQWKGENKGDWSLPGGLVEPGESPAQAIIREVREETGLEVVPKKVIAVFGGQKFQHRYPNGDLIETMIIVFRCMVVGGSMAPLDEETVELEYFSASERPALKLPFPEDVLFDQVKDTYFEL